MAATGGLVQDARRSCAGGTGLGLTARNIALAHSALSRLLFYFPCQVALFHPFVLYLQVGSTSGRGWGTRGLICCRSQGCDGEGGKRSSKVTRLPFSVPYLSCVSHMLHASAGCLRTRKKSSSQLL